MKNKFFIIFVLFLLVFSLSLYFFGSSFFYSYKKIENFAQEAGASIVTEIKKEISISGSPLRLDKIIPSGSNLTVSGVFVETNKHRSEAGMSPLSFSVELNAAAQLKVQDMFDKQYFAHVGPDGNSVDYWAGKTGYAFLKVGENLALGGFEDDKALVQAWMDSKGHRENILNKDFSEIGIAVGKGEFDGKQIWLAVQVFGLPDSACPQPDVSLKESIDVKQNKLVELQEQLEELRKKIENSSGIQRNEYTDQYNAIVEIYNREADTLRKEVSTYNEQVQVTNDCIASY